MRTVHAVAALLLAGLLGGCVHSGPKHNYSQKLGLPPCQTDVLVPGSDLLEEPFKVTDSLVRCDISKLAVAVRDDGEYTPLYADEPNTFDSEKGLVGGRSVGEDPGPRIISELIKKAEAHGDGRPLKILVFAHGGLVSHESAVANAEELAPAMLADGFEPIFLIWNSDFPLTYWDRLCCVRDGIREGRNNDARDKPAQLLFAATRIFGDVGSGIARLPENYTKQTIRYYQTNVRKTSFRYNLSHTPLDLRVAEQGPPRSVANGPSTDELSTSSFHCGYFLSGLERREALDVTCPLATLPPLDTEEDLNLRDFKAGRVLKDNATIPIKATTSFLTGAGAQAWHNMVRRTRIAFAETYSPNEGLIQKGLRPSEGEKAAEKTCERYSKAKTAIAQTKTAIADPMNKFSSGGFSKFFGLLSLAIEDGCFVSSEDEKVPVEIHLVGHSMGGFVVNEAITRHPELPIANVTYMAAANSSREFEIASRELLNAKRAKTRSERSPQPDPPVAFFNLTLHPITESREENLSGALPLGSLLEWIDEYFEGPRTFNDRTWGKWNNAMIAAGAMDPNVQQRLAVRVFPLAEETPKANEPGKACGPSMAWKPDGGRRCHPLKHGELNDYTFWRPAYVCDAKSRNYLCWARFTRSAAFCDTLDKGDIDACKEAAKRELEELSRAPDSHH